MSVSFMYILYPYRLTFILPVISVFIILIPLYLTIFSLSLPRKDILNFSYTHLEILICLYIPIRIIQNFSFYPLFSFNILHFRNSTLVLIACLSCHFGSYHDCNVRYYTTVWTVYCVKKEKERLMLWHKCYRYENILIKGLFGYKR